ncbi:hypothetical protein [uncultured Eubacterium sp.]|uniref:hypothetical protein n=1 Tax=uncultured Eubacterium sp. TaxID=165185 RepID=UPI00259A1894|nr:hypothetical protein [uncultured Eubacterium sp.]
MLPEGYKFDDLPEDKKLEINFWESIVDSDLENAIDETCSDLECSFTLATIAEEILRSFKESFTNHFYSSIDEYIIYALEKEGEKDDE